MKQPPSGGCVLKPIVDGKADVMQMAAAFGRLCVETRSITTDKLNVNAAAFGRLCVETRSQSKIEGSYRCSRLRAVVC